MLESSSYKDRVENLLFFLFRVGMLPSSLIKFDLLNSLNFDYKLLGWITLFQLAEDLPVDVFSWSIIDSFSLDGELSMLIKFCLSRTHIGLLI